MYHVPLVFQCIFRLSDEGAENEIGKEGRKWRVPGFFYADNLFLYGEA